MSLFVIAACGDNSTEATTEPTPTVEPMPDPRVVDTTKTDTTADDKEGATRVIR